MADYIALEDIKRVLKIEDEDTTDDIELALAISAASKSIDRFCNTTFGEDDEEIPASIEQACLIQAIRFFKRKDSPWGVAGSPEMGNEMRLLANLDPDVQVLILNEKNWWWVAEAADE